MNANLLPQTPVINAWLKTAGDRLSDVGITSARLDAELILTSILDKPRTYLHAHNDVLMNPESIKLANSILQRRLKYEPIAYVLGYKYFYGRKFIVNVDTLIPRPESEDIIDLLRIIVSDFITNTDKINLVDVGSGSGCLGITAKLELPSLNVTLADISDKALEIAKQNAKKLSVRVNTLKSDLLKEYRLKPRVIIANLPYVDIDWERSPETNYEPRVALFAEEHGLKIIKNLIIQASKRLPNDGYLIIEADPIQHASLLNFAKKHRFKNLLNRNYCMSFQKLGNARTNTVK
jgi:release factor glutamine methyltransferase